MIKKNDLINSLIDIEGGYVNDVLDSGGETNYGITLETARRNGYVGRMIDMTYEDAFDIYANEYWDSISGDALVLASPNVCGEVFEFGVHAGPNKAARVLQRCLNIFNNRQNLYHDLVVDGNLGKKSLLALDKYLLSRDESVLLRAQNSLQGAHYVELAERREKDERFTYGWFDHRVKI